MARTNSWQAIHALSPSWREGIRPDDVFGEVFISENLVPAHKRYMANPTLE
jgi:hypothetical protein